MLYKTYFFMNSSFKTIAKGKTCCEQQVQAPLYYTQIDKAPPLHKGDAYCIEIAYFLEFIFKQKHEHKLHKKQKQRNDSADQCLFILFHDFHLPKHRIFQQHGLFFL